MNVLARQLGVLGRGFKSQDYRDLILSHNPVAYWRLGEASGTVAYDETGAFHGAYYGGVTLGQAGALTGDKNSSAWFNGGYMDTGRKFDEVPFSIECWAKVAPGTGDGFLFSSQINASTDGYELLVNALATRVLLRYKGVDSVGSTLPVTHSPGVWSHFVATFTDSLVELYVNGGWVAGTVSKNSAFTSSQNLMLNRRGGLSSEYRIDEFAIYNRALTTSEILEHYTKGTIG